MNKENKITLEKLKVESFTTSENNKIKGGAELEGSLGTWWRNCNCTCTC